MEIDSPLIIENDGELQTHLYPSAMTHQEYGALVAAVVRHIANAFKVREDGVWEFADKERYNPTTPIREFKPN